MMGIFEAMFQSRMEVKQANAYRQMAWAAMHNQIEASARAEVVMPYLGHIIQPAIEKRGGEWFAIIETGPSVPKVEKRT